MCPRKYSTEPAGTGKLASVKKIWAYLDQQWMLARPRMQAFTHMVRQLEGIALVEWPEEKGVGVKLSQKGITIVNKGQRVLHKLSVDANRHGHILLTSIRLGVYKYINFSFGERILSEYKYS